jgi:hypothetical protein
MSFLKGNNLIYHPLNYMLFNLLYWMFSLFHLQWCFSFILMFHFIFSLHFYRCSVILLGSKWEGDSKKIVTHWAMCQSRMLPVLYKRSIRIILEISGVLCNGLTINICPFSFCPSIYGFWIPLWYLQTFLTLMTEVFTVSIVKNIILLHVTLYMYR